MGLLGFIGNAGFSSGTFCWIAVIAGILGLILLISLLYGDGPIFFTKIFYGILFVGCLVITVGAIKGYAMQRQIEEILGDPQPQYQPQYQQGQAYQPQYQPQQAYQPQYQ